MKSSKKQKKNNIKKIKKNNELVKCSDEIIKLIESNTMIELFEYEKQIIEKNECFICFEIIIGYF